MSRDGFCPTVVLDVDGVVADFLGAVRRELFRCGPAERPDGWQDDQRAQELTHHGSPEYGSLDKALVKWLWPRVDADPTWWMQVPPLAEVQAGFSGIAELLRRIKMRADVLWVTSRRSKAYPAGHQTEVWLRRQWLETNPHVVALPDWRRKVELFRVLQPVAVVDDRPEILVGAREACPKALILAPPWPCTAGAAPEADRCMLATALGRIAEAVGA